MSLAVAKDKRAERANVWDAMTKLMETARSEDRDMSAEEAESYDKHEARLDTLTKDIEREERHAEQEKRMSAPVDKPIAVRTDEPRSEEERTVRHVSTEEYRDAFNQYLRFGFGGMSEDHRAALKGGFDAEARAQAVGTDAAGGYLVPTEFHRELLEAQKFLGGVRQVARVIQTTSGGDIEFPTEDDTAVEGELLGENVAAAEQDATFGQKILKAYKYSSKIIKVSIELLQDSAFDLDAHLKSVASRRLARITERHFSIGDNTGKPQGVVNYSSAGATAAGGAAITWGDLVDLEHSVDPAYRNSLGGSTAYMFADSTLKAVKKLLDSTGRPIWTPGIDVKEPDTINGYRYTINTYMSAIGTGNKSVLFGDFDFYLIRDVAGATVLRLVERYAEYGQVAFLIFERHDGRGIGAEATTATIKHLVHP